MKISFAGKIIVASLILCRLVPPANAAFSEGGGDGEGGGSHHHHPPHILHLPPIVTPRPPRTAPPPAVPAVQAGQPVVPTDTRPAPRLLGIQVPQVIVRAGMGGYVHACASCQGSVVSDGNVVLIPAKGSLYEVTHDGTVRLARGRILVAGAKVGTEFVASAARVSIASGTCALVEVLADSTVRTFVLTGSSGSHPSAIVHPASGPPSAIELVPGRLAIVATHDLPNEELIRADGIETSPIEGSITEQTSRKVRVRAFSREQMLEKNLLVGCASTTSRPNTQAGQALKELQDKLHEELQGQGSPPQNSAAADAVATSALPVVAADQQITVACQERAPGHAVVELNQDRLIIVSPNAEASQQGEHTLSLGLGSALVSCKNELKVVARNACVTVSHGAMVLITSSEGSVRVACLSDKQGGSVKVSYASRIMNLTSGREVFLSDLAPSLSEVYDFAAIGRRSIHSYDLRSNGWLTRSDLSIADVLAHHPILKSVRAGADSSLRDRIVEPLLRTAAALELVAGQKGAYAPGSPGDEMEAEGVVAAR